MAAETKLVGEEDGFEQLVDNLDPHTHCLLPMRSLRNDIFRERALSVKQKWLIALVMAIGDGRKDVVGYYVDEAFHAGAIRTKILDAADVAVIMGADLGSQRSRCHGSRDAGQSSQG